MFIKLNNHFLYFFLGGGWWGGGGSQCTICNMLDTQIKIYDIFTFSCEQESKTGCRFTKKVYDKSRRAKFGSHCREQSPSNPIDGHDININDSISGHARVVADKQSSVS